MSQSIPKQFLNGFKQFHHVSNKFQNHFKTSFKNISKYPEQCQNSLKSVSTTVSNYFYLGLFAGGTPHLLFFHVFHVGCCVLICWVSSGESPPKGHGQVEADGCRDSLWNIINISPTTHQHLTRLSCSDHNMKNWWHKRPIIRLSFTTLWIILRYIKIGEW